MGNNRASAMSPFRPLAAPRKTLVLANPKSGPGFSVDALWRAIDDHFGGPGREVLREVSRDVDDGRRKTEQALRDGVDTVLVAGGDGMVNSIGAILAGTPAALGVIPAGSGNGFARHFGIPLALPAAVAALACADRRAIDVGLANGRPFFVTCGMAWDAAIARGFAAFPFRGILPYVFAADAELVAYVPQPVAVSLDGGPWQTFAEPVIFTVANLTQYGGGARIAPRAQADDGLMEMVVVLRSDLPVVLMNLGRLFNGTLDRLPQVRTHRCRTLDVRRETAAPIQLDGELVPAGREVEIRLRPRALEVLVPRAAGAGFT